MNEETNTKNEIITDAGYIKLTRNSRGYNWDIKALVGAKKEEYEALIKLIGDLDNAIENRFGSIKIKTKEESQED